MIPEWFRHAIGYEIYPQSFLDTNGDGIGDFAGIVSKLDYIKDLGCNMLWLNPCFDSPMNDAGYDVRNYELAAPRYGTNEDLENLFVEAHKKGMHVLLDLVIGHTSVEHPWYQKSQQPERNEYSDRYIWTNHIFDKPTGYYWNSGASLREGNALVNFFDSQPALNYGFAKIKYPWQMSYEDPRCQANFDAVLDIMRFWLSRGCDGFRVDMAASLVKDDKDKTATASLWHRAQSMLQKEFPEAVLISEWAVPDEAIGKAEFQGDFYLGFDGPYYSSLMRNGKESYFRSEGEGNLDIFLKNYTGCYERTKDKGYMCFVTGNHDQYRAAWQLSPRELKVAYAFLMTMPGVPFVYAGDEIGMRYLNLVTKEGGYFRTGSRTPIQWNHEKNYGFSSARKNKLYLPQDESADAPTVSDQEKDPESLLNFLHSVLALRQEQDADLCADAPYEAVYVGRKGYPFVYRRGNLLLAMNPCAKEKKLPMSIGEPLLKLGEFRNQAKGAVLGAQSFIIWKE